LSQRVARECAPDDKLRETHHGGHGVVSELGAMVYYRRNFVSGAGYFFTVNLADRKSCLLIDHIGELRAAFRYVRQRHPFALDAIVVLPDHLHAIWTLPEGDADFSVRWRLIKSAFSRALPAGEQVSRSRAAKGERGFARLNPSYEYLKPFITRS
jgi:REP element-mobilizing transposase RayT